MDIFLKTTLNLHDLYSFNLWKILSGGKLVGAVALYQIYSIVIFPL